MHSAAFATLNLRWEYEAVTVPIDRLPAVFPDLARSCLGLNVTRPLKTAVLPLLDRLSAAAKRARSVNTVIFRDGLGLGASTDGAGFLAALDDAVSGTPERAVILGSGGAARAVVSALRARGTAVAIAGRNADASRSLASDLGASLVSPGSRALQNAVSGANLLVNATPLGGLLSQDELPIPDSISLHGDLVVFDLVYRPRRTALLRLATAYGCSTIEGVEMLIEQGARSLELWTGRVAPVETMRTAAHRALDDIGWVELPAPARGLAD
jgi:shikimate dehydrogenase